MAKRRDYYRGTVFGPQLCCINISITIITPAAKTEAIAYVDHIIGVGNKEHIIKVIKNLSEMERKKKYTFNVRNGKSHYAVWTGTEKPEEIEITLAK